MKTLQTIILFVVLSLTCYSQTSPVAGKWSGKLSLPGIELTLVLNINEKDGTLNGTMDSPDQGATGILCDLVTFTDNKLAVSVMAIRGKYEGTLSQDGNTINGTWKQNKYEFPLVVTRQKTGETNVSNAPKRPQTPAKPYPYIEQEVTFISADGSTELAGTLTRPMGTTKVPTVVLVSGSGPQDRDETLLNHKPFLVLADTLTKLGFAVLRYDDRGVAKSKGNFSDASTFDFALDAEGAINFLKTRNDIDANKIGLLGHSEGGMVAQVLGASNKDLNFIIMLAAPGIKLNELLIQQNRDVMASQGQLFTVKEEAITRKAQSLAIRDLDSATAARELHKLLTQYRDALPAGEKEALTDENIQGQISTLLSKWFRAFLRFNPAEYLEKITVPVLAINGDKDIQVAAKTNTTAIISGLKKAGNTNYTVKIIPGLNHLFQHCKVCSVSEYGQIEETFAPEAMGEIVSFLRKQKLIN